MGEFAKNDLVLHVVGPVTEAVFGFLGPATAALAEAGVRQTVMMIDDPRLSYLIPRFEQSIELIRVPRRRKPVETWLAMRRAVKAYLESSIEKDELFSLHVHGFVPFLLALPLHRKLKMGRTVHFSSHSSRILGLLRWLGAVSIGTSRLYAGGRRHRALAHLPDDMERFAGVAGPSVTLIENPVANVFLQRRRQEGGTPTIVSGDPARSSGSVTLFSQVAILLGSESGVEFKWIGRADLETRRLLGAAGVLQIAAELDAVRADVLDSAWIYLAGGGSRGFTLGLAEAMAMGLPCVAMDTPMHRSLIEHGDNGYLCSDPVEIVSHMAELLESAELRRAIGEAARRTAVERFAADKFRSALFSIYQDEGETP